MTNQTQSQIEDENEVERDVKHLFWGQTPWDNLSRDQLLREVQRMYAAITSLYSVVRIAELSSPVSPYWGYEGTGGTAKEMARQILDDIYAEYDQDSVYRSFFRYAGDLLFEKTGYRIGFDWCICPKCDTMVGPGPGKVQIEGERCSELTPFGPKDCDGIMRPIVWDDLKPVAPASDAAPPEPASV